MTEESIIIAPSLEETEESNEFELDAALNALAMNTLTYMNDQVGDNKDIADDEQAYVMFHAAKAVLFNIMMHISDNSQIDPRELAQQSFEELMQAIDSMSGGCCGGGEHHHH